MSELETAGMRMKTGEVWRYNDLTDRTLSKDLFQNPTSDRDYDRFSRRSLIKLAQLQMIGTPTGQECHHPGRRPVTEGYERFYCISLISSLHHPWLLKEANF